ncbi:radical SAM protein, partial [Patescibacteria group bacterium]|nr:radical SAM protein [Patescibacteria group bacterium]
MFLNKPLFARSLYPELITFIVTNRCNFNCPGCSSNSPLYTRKNSKVKEISLDDIKRVIDEVAGFKPFIYLNGGEPTLRPDLIEIIKYIKSK